MGDPLYASPERKELYYMYIMGVREKKKIAQKKWGIPVGTLEKFSMANNMNSLAKASRRIGKLLL